LSQVVELQRVTKSANRTLHFVNHTAPAILPGHFYRPREKLPTSLGKC